MYRVIRVSFRAGGTFEVDGERAPDFYLAMNQIDAGTRPERPINVEGSVLFAPSFGHEVVGVDVQTSLHAEDPFTYEAYNEPRDLVDAIVLRLDNGDALRFSTSGTAIALELMGPDGLVRKASWGSLKSAFFNPADVTIDCVTGFASKSGALCFGRKGCRFAEAGCLTLRPMSSSGWPWYRGTAFIRRDKAAFFAMADYLLHPTRKEGERNFSRREWFAYLARVRQLMSDPRFAAPSGPSVFSGAFADSHDLALLEDVERWSAKALRPDARMRLSFGQPNFKTNQCCHLIIRIANRAFFLNDEEKTRFVERLCRVATFSCVEVLAYCFMSNHFHILVYVPDPRELSDDELLARIRALYSGTALAEIEKEWELLGKIGGVNGRGRFRKRYLPLAVGKSP